MKPNDKASYDQRNQMVARFREDARERGFEGYYWVNKAVPPATQDTEIVIVGMELPLKGKYLTTLPYKFGGVKKKSSNSGGTGRAGRRKRNPRFPTNVKGK